MNLLLKRNYKRKDGIFGKLFIDLHKGMLQEWLVTLEHAYPFDDGICAKVPPGTYVCERGIHTLSHGVPFETFEVMDVPGHSGILFHIGNTQSDSSGCILLGDLILERDVWAVINSKVSFKKFMALQDHVDHFDLTIEGE